jgi:hypothetical protein
LGKAGIGLPAATGYLAEENAPLITSVDDSGSTFGDGSIYFYDSFLSTNLGAGDYILAIGAYILGVRDAIDQIPELVQLVFTIQP